jgi:hypothetical protein
MHPRPTHDDANLILRLYEMRREDRMRKARAWFASTCKGVHTFEALMAIAPGGSDENASFRMVVSYWDLAASFVTSGVLHRELFFQSGREMLVVWVRLRQLLPSLRAAYKDPNYMRNLETVGQEFADYMKAADPDAYEAFVARIS